MQNSAIRVPFQFALLPFSQQLHVCPWLAGIRYFEGRHGFAVISECRDDNHRRPEARFRRFARIENAAGERTAVSFSYVATADVQRAAVLVLIEKDGGVSAVRRPLSQITPQADLRRRPSWCGEDRAQRPDFR